MFRFSALHLPEGSSLRILSIVVISYTAQNFFTRKTHTVLFSAVYADVFVSRSLEVRRTDPYHANLLNIKSTNI